MLINSLELILLFLFLDYSTQQLSDRSDKQDYQQQFGLMNDHAGGNVLDSQDHHQSSEFSSHGGSEIALSFPASSRAASRNLWMPASLMALTASIVASFVYTSRTFVYVLV